MPHVQVSVFAASSAAVPGTSLPLAIRLQPDPGWHTYWRNPGQAGRPTRVDWTLPAGVTASPLRWPAPRRITSAGIVSFGYPGTSVLLTTLHLPSLLATSSLTIRGDVSWLACRDMCVPEHAMVSLTLPVSSKPTPLAASTAQLFESARAALPQPLPAALGTDVRFVDHTLTLDLALPDPGSVRSAMLIPDTSKMFEADARQSTAVDGGTLQLQIRPVVADPHAISGVFEVTRQDGSRQDWAIPTTATASEPSGTAMPFGLLLALLLAFAGGLCLNLMPCVLPVLSLKVVALVQVQRHSQRQHVFAYAAGTVLSCLALAAGLLVLRAGGHALGWGFQLQSPEFVAALAELLFVLGLSMSGVASFGERLMGTGQRLTGGQGLSASFFAGVLVVVVSTPCSAPFMGTALCYAVTLPTMQSLLVFALLGTGLSFPILLIALMPRLARWLPRPGAWMETFKQVMAFPLYLSAVWLVWVLLHQTSRDAVGMVLLSMVILAAATWARGRWPLTRWTSLTMILSLLLCLGMISRIAPARSIAADVSAAGTSFSRERLASLRRSGQAVLVDISADWCLTCKVNERVALDAPAVRAALTQHDVTVLTGDWTRRDPHITRFLARFHRNGVPLYVLFEPRRPPRVLPQILTPGLVLDALRATPP